MDMGTTVSGCSGMIQSEVGIVVLAVMAIVAVCLVCLRKNATSTEK